MKNPNREEWVGVSGFGEPNSVQEYVTVIERVK